MATLTQCTHGCAGQTSSGKTHTMKGTDTEPGIIPLAVREIFALLSSCQDREFLLRVAYMEVRLSFQCSYAFSLCLCIRASNA